MSFSATFQGRCTVCGESIEEGDMIDRDPDDNGWCHEECSDEAS